jgi:uncharacterized protein
MLRQFWARVLAIGLVVSLALPLAVPTVTVAQERRSPSILEFFGLRPAEPRVIILKPRPKLKKKISKAAKTPGRKKTKSIGGIPTAGPLPQVPVNPAKAIDARSILVIGDFMAGGLAEGLEAAFEGEAAVQIIDKSKGSSGFVRDDVFNWPQNVAALIAEIEPSVVVVMIGTNDRQQMVVGGTREAIQSPAWSGEYDRRVSAFSAALQTTGVPVVWVGLPPFKQRTMSAGILAFNDMYAKKAESITGSFVDIWDGFLDDQGMFTINGFDYTGQPAKLRASDGINLTTAGKRKAAFFAEKPIRVALGSVSPTTPLATVLGPFALPGPVRPSKVLPENITTLPPISLFDPAFDGGTELMGGSAAASEGAANLPATALYQRGEMPEPQPGRIDEVRVRAKISPLPSGKTGSVATAP